MGLRASNTAAIICEECEIPAEGGYGFIQGLPGRETDARREDHAAVRGRLADPAADDRSETPLPRRIEQPAAAA
jgi:hypothetical protein